MKCLWHQSPKPPQTSGQSSVRAQIHQSDALDQKYKRQKTIPDWFSVSAFDAENAPLCFEQHPSNTYYTGVDHDNDPDLSIHAQDDSFDDDCDPAFTPKQISIMKSTMRDILKEFQGSNLQKTDLNQTLENLKGRLHRKSKSTTKSIPPRSRSLGRLRYGLPEFRHSSHSDDRNSLFIFGDQTDSEQDSDESIEEGSLNQPLA